MHLYSYYKPLKKSLKIFNCFVFYTDIEIGDWLTQPDGTRLRDFTYTLFLNYSFGPKYSPCVERQIYYKNGQPGVRHVVKSEVSVM